MHEQKRLVAVAALSVLGFAGAALAQKDAAEKAQEGGIDHWIEYYKAQQPKAAIPVPRKSAPSPDDLPTPGAPSQENRSSNAVTAGDTEGAEEGERKNIR